MTHPTPPAAASDFALAQAFRELDTCGQHTAEECAAYNRLFNRAREIESGAGILGEGSYGGIAFPHDAIFTARTLSAQPSPVVVRGEYDWEDDPLPVAQPSGVAGDWVMVPRVPTQAMYEAWAARSEITGKGITFKGNWGNWRHNYNEMLATSPIAQQDYSNHPSLQVPCKHCGAVGMCPAPMACLHASSEAIAQQGGGDSRSEHLAILGRLKDALPTVGLNGWVKGVASIQWAMLQISTHTHPAPPPNWCRTCGKHWDDPKSVFCSDGIHKQPAAPTPAATGAGDGSDWLAVAADLDKLAMDGWICASVAAQYIRDHQTNTAATGMGDAEVVWLRPVDAGTDNECWFVGNKCDPGAIPYVPYLAAQPAPVVGGGYIRFHWETGDPVRPWSCKVVTHDEMRQRYSEMCSEEMTHLMEIHQVSDLPALVRMLLRFNENLRSRQMPDPQIPQRAPREG